MSCTVGILPGGHQKSFSNTPKIMVTIIGYRKRQNGEGKDFFTLILMGGVEFIKSSQTGNFYATAWKSSITCTFNEEICKSLVGTKVKGSIERMDTEPYDYKLPGTEETIVLTHKFKFNPTPNTLSMEETVFDPELQVG